jgi:fatty-acid desaturase
LTGGHVTINDVIFTITGVVAVFKIALLLREIFITKLFMAILVTIIIDPAIIAVLFFTYINGIGVTAFFSRITFSFYSGKKTILTLTWFQDIFLAPI